MFDAYLEAWRLVPDGTPFDTNHSWILHVQCDGKPATLKLRKPESDETQTAAMLRYYDGCGAVRVLDADGDVVLMERARGARSLWAMALGDEDTEAAHILAEVIAELHSPRIATVPAGLPSLSDQFAPLLASAHADPRLASAADIARDLLFDAEAPIVLHGDLHHNNVLFDAVRGWLAIDPKGLVGDRGYDVANLLCNPWPYGRFVHDRDRALRCAAIYSERLVLDRRRILAFAATHAGLASAWAIEDGRDPKYWLTCVDLFLAMV